MALIEVIGHLIRELVTSGADEEQRQTQKQTISLYDELIVRLMDISSYVRSKVLQVLSKLCELKVKFPKQRLQVTAAAVSALSDKVSTVRKGAASLLVQLLLTHPYVMHGGFLEQSVFEAEFERVKQELAKVEDKMGKAVERNDEDDADHKEDEEDGEAKLSKKKKKR